MSEIILHEYPESPFSEKVRLLLGYKGLSYHSVTIPIIMPKPFLMPLTGGYRKTPVMQIGRDVYCDSAIICRVIDDIEPDNPIYPDEAIATAGTVAHWTDTFFFKVCVSVAFQPRAAATNPLFQDPEAIAAFMADRAQLSAGSTELGMAFEVAEPHFLAHINRLDAQLGGGSKFLFGDTPTIADFSTYHCCWFIHSVEVLCKDFEPFPNLLAWYERMSAFGHGKVSAMTGEAALEVARKATLDTVEEEVFLEDFEAGQAVEVLPIDYGFQPVAGELLTASFVEIVIRRVDPDIGEIAVHFPRFGFRVRVPA